MCAQVLQGTEIARASVRGTKICKNKRVEGIRKTTWGKKKKVSANFRKCQFSGLATSLSDERGKTRRPRGKRIKYLDRGEEHPPTHVTLHPSVIQNLGAGHHRPSSSRRHPEGSPRQRAMERFAESRLDPTIREDPGDEGRRGPEGSLGARR